MFSKRDITVTSTIMSRLVYAFILFFGTVSAVLENYYWRNYNGTIPEDAVIGGQSFGHNIYIGQAYIRNEGVIPVTINPGVKEVSVALRGVRRVDNYIKILCGHQDEFQWLPATAANLHVELLDKRPVLGGHDDYRTYLYIGQVNVDGGTIIARVDPFTVGDATMMYPEKNLEKTVKEYSVLCFEDFGFDFDIRMKPTKTNTTM